MTLRRSALISFLSVVALTACTTGNPVNVQQELNRWIGSDSDRLVHSWGPPDRSYDFKDGSRVMEYERNRIDTYGGWNSGAHGGISIGSRGSAIGIGAPLLMDEPSISVRRCVMKFETDKKRVIRHTAFSGRNCAYALQNVVRKSGP